MLLSNHELGLSDLRHQDFTPIAILATEWISLSASNQSHLSSGKEVMKKLKADPKSLTMGVPGSGTTAVILGAVVMLGLQPGPLLFEKQPEMVWTLVNSMFIGNIFLVIINIAMIGLLLKILKTPPKTLYPIILVLAFLGTYTLSYSVIDFYILLIFGIIGLLLKLLDFPIAPLILASIIGSDMEQNFRKSLITSHNQLGDIFFGSPIATVLTIMTALALFYPFIMKLLKKKTASN